MNFNFVLDDASLAEDIIKAIEHYRRINDLPKTEVCRALQITPPTYKKWLEQGEPPTKVAFALNLFRFLKEEVKVDGIEE